MTIEYPVNTKQIKAKVIELDNKNQRHKELIEETHWTTPKYLKNIKEIFYSGISCAGEQSYQSKVFALVLNQEGKDIIGALASIFSIRPAHFRPKIGGECPADLYIEFLEVNKDLKEKNSFQELGRAIIDAICHYSENRNFILFEGISLGKKVFSAIPIKNISVYCKEKPPQEFYEHLGFSPVKRFGENWWMVSIEKEARHSNKILGLKEESTL
ncbi:MAG: hypothetical protein QNJ31_05295 [Candidatus Caenarcaniphilales bacterium]|nr:hypothetical protein [Candidatus Caenarcaniphilales bacterium]